MAVSSKKVALIIVDVQKDFGLHNGALYVPQGEQVVAEINKLRDALGTNDVFLTQDWHPADHVSFVTQHPGSTVFQEKILPNGTSQVMWPPHCQQGSLGAEFLNDLTRSSGDIIIQKGLLRDVDSYSGFASNDGYSEKTNLQYLLNEKHITHLIICGLAFDYCVKYTALDAIEFGFDVCLVRSCCRGITFEGISNSESALIATGGATIVDSVEMAVAWSK
jgi:nicotinamidase/pyrazinamidase